MKHKWLYKIFVAVFIAVSLIPSVGMLVFGSDGAAANEILTSRPQLFRRDGSFNLEVLSETADYIADHFAFRQKFVTGWSRLNAGLFHSSVEEQVILGENGWLYYAQTLNDYMGEGLTDVQLGYVARNLALMQEYAESHGARMVFTVAPNKNSLYPENMPHSIPQGHESANAARLPALLAGYGVRYADLFTAFCGEEVLYYQTDSHWNAKGAALAADTILNALDRENAYFDEPFSGTEDHFGDLYEMLYPAGKQTEPNPLYARGFTFVCESDPNGGNAITIHTENPNGSGRLLCWRDSFGIALYPYLAESFEQATFSRASVYDLTQIAERGADTVIVELVERNLRQLYENAAIFPAPKRELGDALSTGEALPLARKENIGSDGALTRISGQLLCSQVDVGSEIYLLADGMYYETCVVSSDSEDTLCFTACLPTENANVQAVIALRDGELIRFLSDFS